MDKPLAPCTLRAGCWPCSQAHQSGWEGQRGSGVVLSPSGALPLEGVTVCGTPVSPERGCSRGLPSPSHCRCGPLPAPVVSRALATAMCAIWTSCLHSHAPNPPSSKATKSQRPLTDTPAPPATLLMTLPPPHPLSTRVTQWLLRPACGHVVSARLCDQRDMRAVL